MKTQGVISSNELLALINHSMQLICYKRHSYILQLPVLLKTVHDEVDDLKSWNTFLELCSFSYHVKGRFFKFLKRHGIKDWVNLVITYNLRHEVEDLSSPDKHVRMLGWDWINDLVISEHAVCIELAGPFDCLAQWEFNPLHDGLKILDSFLKACFTLYSSLLLIF